MDCRPTVEDRDTFGHRDTMQTDFKAIPEPGAIFYNAEDCKRVAKFLRVPMNLWTILQSLCNPFRFVSSVSNRSILGHLGITANPKQQHNSLTTMGCQSLPQLTVKKRGHKVSLWFRNNDMSNKTKGFVGGLFRMAKRGPEFFFLSNFFPFQPFSFISDKVEPLNSYFSIIQRKKGTFRNQWQSLINSLKLLPPGEGPEGEF